MKSKKSAPLAWLFLPLWLILYGLILFADAPVDMYSAFSSIVLCFAYGLFRGKKTDPWMLAALACTLCADYCLVLCGREQRLLGMVFFLGVQSFYGIRLHLWAKSKILWIARILLILAAMGAALLVLGENVDALALISLCYYANLICNIVASFTRFSKNPLLPIGFVLFAVCDTVIGLQVMSESYIPLAADSWLRQVLFVDINLPWLFYLPSQVLLALGSGRERS